ncbi:MAG: 4Fe-4S binding protein [Treponema sp.]|nr:4Fe-4S binding protein [Treponema sp.]
MKKKASFSSLRLFIQVSFALFTNAYFKGFAQGRIFTGNTKYVCIPGLNCYSCPGALFSCPIGALQSSLSGRSFKFSLYVTGFLVLFGTFLGRFTCGFLCPFGLVQDLLYKIPFFKKIRRLPGQKVLHFIRYFILLIFVILLPLFVVDITGLGKPWFCKYICPAGTLEGGIPLVLANSAIRSAVGFLFKWKLFILIFIILLSIPVYRPFCRIFCPLGAVYGLFNKVSFIRYRVDSSKCTACGACQKECKLDIKVWKNPNSIDCIRCGQCRKSCPVKAITLS